MNKFFKFSLVTSSLAVSSLASSANLDKLFLDKAYWTKFNWDGFEKSELYLDSRLETREPESSDAKVYFEKFGDVELNGTEFKESIIKNTLLVKNNRKINLSFKSEQKIPKDEETCGKIVSMFSKYFGSNYETTEYMSMFDNTPLLSKKVKYAEWINGKSNIQIQCTQLMRDNFHVNVIFSPNTEENKVKKPIHLSCERNYKLTANNQTGVARAIHFTVLQDEMEVVNADNNKMGTLNEITNTYIKFTSESEDSKQSYTINRIDGGLSGTFINTKTNQVTANYNGTCEKRTIENRKF
jgi:hypothetical protein